MVRHLRVPASALVALRCLIAAAGLASALVVGGALPAGAHVRSTTGYSEVRSIDDGTVRYELSLEYELLARATGLEEQAEDAPDDRDRAVVLDDGRAVVGEYLESRVGVFLDGASCLPELADTAIEHRQDVAYAHLTLLYACPGSSSSGSYRIDYDVFSDGDAVVDDHTNIVDYDLGDARGRVVLDAGHRSFTAGSGSVLSSTARFVVLGMEHIFEGLDHVLFVVALLLGASGFRGVLKVASAFTVAHSVTLILAVVGWVDVPGEIVEPLIALSIAYIALENLLGGSSRHRLAVVFGFGLLHGLGFASALRFTDELSWSLVTSLLGFNVGIELGQALLIAAVFPVLSMLRRFQWAPLAHAGATGVVALLGIAWFFQRITLT
jgi:HupE / UreJ protein